MSKVTDALLATITQVTDEKGDQSHKTEITLVAGGMLISGLVISASEYYEHHPVSKGYGRVVQKMLVGEQRKEESGEEVYFIHLKDARYWTPAGYVPNEGDGVFVRVKLEDITAFHFGVLRTA